MLSATKSPVASVNVSSGWHVEHGDADHLGLKPRPRKGQPRAGREDPAAGWLASWLALTPHG